jgi:hypothetical protein
MDDVQQVRASTFLPPQGTAHYCPANTLDGRTETAWVEGVGGSGIGEWISFSFDAQVVRSVEVYPGYGKSRETFLANNRLKRVTLIFSDGTKVPALFGDGMGWKTVNLPRAILASSLKIVIEEVYRGTRYDDTCVSEVRWY